MNTDIPCRQEIGAVPYGHIIAVSYHYHHPHGYPWPDPAILPLLGSGAGWGIVDNTIHDLVLL